MKQIKILRSSGIVRDYRMNTLTINYLMKDRTFRNLFTIELVLMKNGMMTMAAVVLVADQVFKLTIFYINE
jgi:hypothetical protein